MNAPRIALAVILAHSAGCSGPDPEPLGEYDATQSGRIAARVAGLESDEGAVIARLYRGGEGFPSDAEAAYREATSPIREGTASFTFEDVPHGEYALWFCHDEDGDGELDTNFLGMPSEGVGVSGPPPSFIPTYAEARFALDQALSEHEIVVKYL